MYDCTASMVIYNNPPEMIRNAAVSFLSTDASVQLTIVDNSPTPALRSAFDGLAVEYHFMGENVGYGRGHNWAISKVGNSRYHLILNPDIIVAPETIKSLAAFMDKNLDIGMVCPKVLHQDGTVQHLNKRLPTVFDLYIRRFVPGPLKAVVRKRMDFFVMKDVGYDDVCDVEYMTGCFMFCRTDALKEVGGFDPRYFMYFEDCDLGREFQKKRHRTVYYPYASVTHLWERASYKSLRMTFVHIVNMIRYFNKWGWKLY